MKTTLRRLLTLVLALAMVLSLLGTSALATDQESKQDKVSSSESGNAGEESGNAGEESGNADATPLMGNKISVNTAVFLTYNKKKAIKFQIKATASDGTKLSYTSNNKRVKVNANGKVSVPKGFKGKFVITVKAKATANYGSAQKKITFMVGPSAVSPASVRIRRPSSQETHCSISRIFSAGSPSAPAMAARMGRRQSPYLEWVFSIFPATFTSLPIWPMSSAP